MAVNKMDTDLLPDVANADLIEEGLYLGNLTAAIEVQALRSRRVSHILTVDSKPLPAYITSLPGMHFMYIKVDDMVHEDLLSYFEEAVQFIEEGQKKGNVLVHCYFGMSRSATLVICFLMKKYMLPLEEALERVKFRRHCVGPNKGFLDQLALYQTMGWNLQLSNGQYRLYMLQVAAGAVMKGNKLSPDHRFKSIIHPTPSTTQEGGPVAYKCKGCRLSLISMSSLLPHCPGETPTWLDSKWSDRLVKITLCQQGIFTFPIAWMGDTTNSLQGKLFCPKCHAKIGSYSWTKGCRCCCDAEISPAFYFVPSKLDRCFME